jgi:hypothetical protein
MSSEPTRPIDAAATVTRPSIQRRRRAFGIVRRAAGSRGAPPAREYMAATTGRLGCLARWVVNRWRFSNSKARRRLVAGHFPFFATRFCHPNAKKRAGRNVIKQKQTSRSPEISRVCPHVKNKKNLRRRFSRPMP